MAKLTSYEAREILSLCKVNRYVDYHTLSSDQVEALLAAADKAKYRKPANANGSRARSFHSRLVRAAERQDD